jgi:hypothetical protein
MKKMLWIWLNCVRYAELSGLHSRDMVLATFARPRNDRKADLQTD